MPDLTELTMTGWWKANQANIKGGHLVRWLLVLLAWPSLIYSFCRSLLQI